ncbi:MULTISPECIES: hypothetical protein [unclassified Roseateles]|uniref:hypothetical protein n=1 Tax=unclassified Roseateles TaxID=2626991 RepID=UPI0006F3E619|nr:MULTISPECIES: hypothetical protein [unclassified Roseateles]KQW45413.1 hypothetical protein ASC81_10870 [Pelomonas sp. Root405]KRA72257.1 hypothetical protein ASD88_10870 [Pelomonas sp. Root662]
MQAVLNTQIATRPALVQFDLGLIDAPAAISAHERTGLALGRDYALHGLTPPIAHLYPQSPLQRGWLAARGRPVRTPASTQVEQWLALRTHAWARGRSFEDIQLTPHHLAQLDTTHCPITRDLLDDSSRSVDRVRDDAGYAAGNLAVMSQRANRAKGQRGHQALADMAASCAAGPITRIGGLTEADWERLAVLSSFVTPLSHEDAAQIPLRVLPPNRLRLFNPVQALQALITRQLATPGWSARLSRLEALLPTDALRTDFNRFLLALAPRVLAANELQEPHQIRWALEDAWALPLVLKRWTRFALQLTPEQAESLVERAAAKKLCPVHIQRHDDATDGWALATAGYAA